MHWQLQLLFLSWLAPWVGSGLSSLSVCSVMSGWVFGYGFMTNLPRASMSITQSLLISIRMRKLSRLRLKRLQVMRKKRRLSVSWSALPSVRLGLLSQVSWWLMVYGGSSSSGLQLISQISMVILLTQAWVLLWFSSFMRLLPSWVSVVVICQLTLLIRRVWILISAVCVRCWSLHVSHCWVW